MEELSRNFESYYCDVFLEKPFAVLILNTFIIINNMRAFIKSSNLRHFSKANKAQIEK
jgi:hypothetical protein